MSDKLPDDDGAVLFGPEGNEDPPERKEIYFNNVYKPSDIELTDNTAATEDNSNTNQIEERATQSNEQLTNGLQDKKNEINRRNIPVIFFSPRWPSKL